MEIFFSRDLFADVMSVRNRNMKHTRAIEINYTNLLALFHSFICSVIWLHLSYLRW